MMRAARFASQLGYRLDPDLLSTITREAGLLDTISRERRRDELEKVLVADDPGAGLRILADTGLLVRVSPELAAMIGVEQPPNYHRADVFEHSVLTVEASEADPLLRRAALFHDVGKPPAKVTEPRTRFPDHQKIGESLTREAMARLRYGKDDIDRTAFLVRRHMRPILYGPEWSDAAVRRFVKDCTMVYGGEVVVPLEMVFSLARADILAGSLETVEQNLALLEGLKKRIESLESVVEVVFAQSPLDGSELMELLDRPPGPWLRDAKEFLQRLVVEGRLDPEDTDEAKRLARDYISDRYGRSP